MAEQHFTVEEANALLPTVAPIVARMVEHRRNFLAALDRRRQLGALSSSNGSGSNGSGFHSRAAAEVGAAVDEAAKGIERCVEELTGLGVLVNDLDTGLVDFPSTRDGEEILLCWRLGEDEIAWWHLPDAGFAGRQPL